MKKAPYKRDLRRYAALLPAVIALAVYVSTTCRSIWIGDSAELALALKTLGIAHLPGYPLFTVAGSIFVQAFFFLRPIFAAGIFNIVVSAALVAIVFLLIRRFSDNLTAGILSLVWAFTPSFWVQTAGVEVYSFNLLLMALTLLAAASRRRFRWPLTFYLLGLSLTVHPSSLALLPPIIFLFVQDREYRNWLRLPLYVGLVVLAGSAYFYLWVRAARDPVADWGHPVGLQAMLNLVTLRQYSGWIPDFWEGVWEALKLYWRILTESWWWIGLAATISGIYLGWRARRAHTICTLLLLVATLLLAAVQQGPDYEPYFLPAMLATLMLIGNNLFWPQGKRIPSLVKLAVGAAAVVAILAANYRNCDKSHYSLYEDFSRLVLNTAQDGVLFATGDIDAFGPTYLRYAEGYQPKVEIYDRSIRRHAMFTRAEELAGEKVDNYYIARAIIFRGDGRQMFLTKNLYMNEPEWLPTEDSLYSYGVLYSVTTPPPRTGLVPNYPPDYDPGDLLSRQLLVNLDLSRGEEKIMGSPDKRELALDDFTLALRRLANEPRANLINNLGIIFRRSAFLDLALEAYSLALTKPILPRSLRKMIRFNISNVHKDRGNAYMEGGDFAKAAASYAEAAKYDPDNVRLLLNIGLIYAQKLNDRANALIYLNQYLKRQPSDDRVKTLVNSLK